MTPIPIGSELRRRRLAAGLSQTTTAQLAHMSQGTYADIERNHTPNITLDTLTRLSTALRCSIIDLIGPSPHPHQ